MVYEGKAIRILEYRDGAIVRLLPGIRGLQDKSETSSENSEYVALEERA